MKFYLSTRVVMGFFKEHSYRDKNGVEQRSTDWGGSIASGMGGAGGFALLIVVAAIYTYWVYAVVLAVSAIIAFFTIKVYVKSDENGKKKITSTVLAFFGGWLGLNNFYNKRYIGGSIKLALFTASTALLSIGFYGYTLYYYSITLLVISGWIEAYNYLFGKSKIIKIMIYTFVLSISTYSVFEYGGWYQRSLITNLNNIANYDEIRTKVTTENFQSLYANNYQKSLGAIKEYDKNPIASFFPNLKSAYSVEGLNALKEVYGNDLKISADDFIGTIERLGKLDKGYSKKLAELITNHMDKEVVVIFNENHKKEKNSSFDIEYLLQKNNQISALRAYRKLKQSYSLK